MKHLKNAAFLFAAATVALAASAGSDAPRKEKVHLDRPALIAGTLIPAGDYRVEIVPDLEKAVFTQGKRTVAEIPCRVGLTRPVYSGNAVHYKESAEGDRLVRIVFADAKLAVDFAGSSFDAAAPGLAKTADRP